MNIVKTCLIILLFSSTLNAGEYNPRLYGRHRNKIPPKYYFYPDKNDYGFDPVPPNFKIAPGFRPNHSWRFGGWYYGQGDYSPGYNGILWFGYEIEY